MGALYLSYNLVKSHPVSAEFEAPKTVQSNQTVRETQPARRDYETYRVELQKYSNSYRKVRRVGFLCLLVGTSTNTLKLELGEKKNKKQCKGQNVPDNFISLGGTDYNCSLCL